MVKRAVYYWTKYKDIWLGGIGKISFRSLSSRRETFGIVYGFSKKSFLLLIQESAVATKCYPGLSWYIHRDFQVAWDLSTTRLDCVELCYAYKCAAQSIPGSIRRWFSIQWTLYLIGSVEIVSSFEKLGPSRHIVRYIEYCTACITTNWWAAWPFSCRKRCRL